MKNFSNFRRWKIFRAAVLCLAFTGTGVGWADSPRPESADYVEDPLAPHRTVGSTARLGTSVGFLNGDADNRAGAATALGLTVAGGQRWGRLMLEAEYSYLELSERGASALRLGDAQRLGIVGRFDVVRLGSSIVGGNSMAAFYVEGGADVAWNDWYRPAADQPSRIVPADTKRVEGQVGFGIVIDHRLQEPIGFPHRIGWMLGWRMALTPHEDVPMTSCRGSTCKPIEMSSSNDRYVDRSMLFGSSLFVTW